MAERRAVRGFTLLEVLIALAILAISAAAVLRQAQLQVKQQFELEAKTYAMWLADDTLAAIAAQPQWPPLGRAENRVTFGDREWLVVTEVTGTTDALLRKVEVRVGPTDVSGDPSLVSFVGYRGRY